MILLVVQRLRHARTHAARVSIILASLALGSALQAQVTPPRGTTLFTTVGEVFAVTPLVPTLVQHAQSGNLCSPGACYTGTLTARGNRGWQLQVKLVTAPETFTVAYVQTTAASSAQTVNSGRQTWLTPTTWVPVATSTLASAGTPIGVMFNARRGQGNAGIQPSGAQVAASVMYRVIAFP